jgi:hypothetical protein
MTTTIDRVRLRLRGRSHTPGRVDRVQASLRRSARTAATTLRDPRSRRHQHAAALHLRRAARRAQRIGVARAVDDMRVKWQLRRGYRHLVAAGKPPHRRIGRRLIAGGVLTGMVVGGAAAGITKVRLAAPKDVPTPATTATEPEANGIPEA